MIARALLSVSDKTGLLPLATSLAAHGIELLSTGGTARALREAGLKVVDVSEHTGFPEIMDGRVKTLHPAIHGGLLARRDDASHLAAMQEHTIAPIDLVVINLYPFEETVARGAGFEECVENIDIGGPSMIRSSAKNHAHVTVLTNPLDYDTVLTEIAEHGGTTAETRKRLAAKAFARTAAYDAAIAAWFKQDALPDRLPLSATKVQALHYGENAHQQAALYALDKSPSLATAKLALGERLSYNNLNDAGAALELAAEFSEPAVAIIKHANPCGVAVGKNLAEAYASALACDPVSAYGGIIAVNREVDAAFAEKLGSLFVEVLIAPAVHADAIPLLEKKKKLRLLLTQGMPRPQGLSLKTIGGALLAQTQDDCVFKDTPRVVTQAQPTEAQLRDARFAFTVAKHVKSNAIVLVKNNATIGIGAGQMSRIDSTRIACWKAGEAKLEPQGAVLASDAFFPFADNVEMAHAAGITCVIQPGGSIRDEEIIARANELGMAMIFTGVRHFRH